MDNLTLTYHVSIKIIIIYLVYRILYFLCNTFFFFKKLTVKKYPCLIGLLNGATFKEFSRQRCSHLYSIS